MAKRKTEFADIRSLRDLQKRTRSPAWALRLLEWLRWPDGRFCPHCGVMDHLPIPGRQAGLYECRGCRGQFSATSGTPLHGTKLPIGVWLEAAFLITSSSKCVSSVVLSKQLGVSQRTAWKIGHAVRLMMRPPDDEPKLSGVVEIDDMTDGGDPYALPRICLRAGVDYLDLSDDAGFTAGIAALDAEAQAAGRRILSGASSVPVTVTKRRTATGEIWERDFGGRAFRSRIAAAPASHRYRERFGLLTIRNGPARRGRVDAPAGASRLVHGHTPATLRSAEERHAGIQ